MPNGHKTKALAFKADPDSFKEEGEIGAFSGYASVFGNVDSYGDIVEPGAFSRTMQNRIAATGRPDFVILWNHDPHEPIGVTVEMAEDERGLRVTGQLNLGVQRARETYALLKQGALSGLSIGYRTIKETVDATGIRHLKELRLYEWSPVTFPANESALIDTVKSEDLSPSAPDAPGSGTDGDPDFLHSLKALRDTLKN